MPKTSSDYAMRQYCRSVLANLHPVWTHHHRLIQTSRTRSAIARVHNVYHVWPCSLWVVLEMCLNYISHSFLSCGYNKLSDLSIDYCGALAGAKPAEECSGVLPAACNLAASFGVPPLSPRANALCALARACPNPIQMPPSKRSTPALPDGCTH